MKTSTTKNVLVGILGGAGVMHFVTPRFFDAIVPGALPGTARTWTYLSGVAELVVAGAVANPTTRRRGAYAAAALFVAVFPANIKAAADTSGKEQVVAVVRLPLQYPLIRWALKLAKAS